MSHKKKGRARFGLALAALALVVAPTLTRLAPASDFIRADSNQDLELNIVDAVFTLNYLTGSGSMPCLDAGDANDDGAVDIVDAVLTLHILFAGTALPQAPWPNCGADPTADSLDCASPICP
ncbi:MAG: hypothetical protein AAF581_08510 [Planctomycetota bacterium]